MGCLALLVSSIVFFGQHSLSTNSGYTRNYVRKSLKSTAKKFDARADFTLFDFLLAILFQADDPCNAYLITFLCCCCAEIQEKNQMKSNPGAGGVPYVAA